jgi:SAM-dependent methyltransferase
LYEYRANFYQYLASFAVRSAQRIVPKVAAMIQVRSVVDFGCGQGAWLSVWAATGALVTGVDGPYVDRQGLLIEANDFHAADLAAPLDLGRRFDLVQSLEVAEHLPAAKAEQFVDTLTKHGACVLFSAAVPGQGGENHINEQPAEYWRAIFRERGYSAVDYIRRLICDDRAIAPWYRHNIMLYVKDDAIAALPDPLRSCRVPDSDLLEDYRPLCYRLRHAVVRRLPSGVAECISRTKGALRPRGARF